MGSEDLFHKRKARSKQQLQRKKERRSPYDKILIVCEGEKTEPNYFNGARMHYQLSTVNVEIVGKGQDPLGLVNYAKQQYDEEVRNGDPFDMVFCVFDKDQHVTYEQAIQSIQDIKPAGVWHAINSVPSFEYWLLLHFTYTERPYRHTSTTSSGDQVLRDLKSHMPTYSKAMKNVFAELLDKLEEAKCSAKNVLRSCERNQTDNPSTRVHILIDKIQSLKKD